MAGGRNENGDGGRLCRHDVSSLFWDVGYIESIAVARENRQWEKINTSSVKNRLYGFVAGFYAESRESNEKNLFGEKKIHAQKLKRKYIRQVYLASGRLFSFEKKLD